MNTICIDPRIIELRHKIRNAQEPDNPHLIQRWLMLDACCLNRRGLSLCKRCPAELQRHHCEQQFYLLLDTITDESLPSHWRCTCLDNIYRPLGLLHKLADSPQSYNHWRMLKQELATCTSYVSAGLNYPNEEPS